MQEDYIQSQRMMLGIVREMKEVPELESEKPKDVNALQRVEFPDGGGVLTYMENHPYPYRGFPFYEFVDRIDQGKKFSRGLISGLYHATKTSWWKRFLMRAYLKDVVYAEICTIHRSIDRFKIKKERYCNAVREVHRAWSIPVPFETERGKEIREKLRDIFCMYLECDNAYRFRWQDAFEELDYEKFKKDPIKETLAMFDLNSRREKLQEVKDSWFLVKLLINGFLKHDKDALKAVVHATLLVDKEKVKMDLTDKYWCVKRLDYTFGFMMNPSQDEKILIGEAEKQKKWSEIRGKIQEESTKAHQELGERQNRELLESKEKIPENERNQIQSNIEETNKKVSEEFNGIVKRLQDEYQKKGKDLTDALIPQEHRELLKKQLKEREELSAFFDAKMKEADENHVKLLL